MSLNIIDLIKGQLGPALVSQSAAQLGESESGISKAISALVPTVVGGLAHNADNPVVVNSVKDLSATGLLSNLLGGTSDNSIISTILASLFGGKLSGIINTIASYAGINEGSASSLLNVVTGATLGSVGKYAADNNLDSGGISALLKDQKGILTTLIPGGLSLASLGFDNWYGSTAEPVNVQPVVEEFNENDGITEPVVEKKVEVTRGGATHIETTTEESSSIWKWLLPLLLLLVAGWFLWKQCQNKKTTETTTLADTTVVDNDTATVITDSPAAKVDSDIDLNGTNLKGYAGGMEDRMIAFLKSGNYEIAADDAALKDTWYDFDHVNFKMASATELEAGSQGQLDNLLAILKAYPSSKIKIGGYTDKTGNEAANVKLSQERATFIKKWLTDKGVGAQVLEAQGYGSQFATVDAAASDAERATDRKMAVRFAK